MTTATTVRSVADALQDASRWRADEQSRKKAQIIEVEQQLAELRVSLAKLQEKLTSLEEFRESLGGTEGALEKGEAQRAHEGIFAALDEQRAVIEERSAELLKAEERRLEILQQVLAESDLADKLVEYRQFKETVEPALANMPESYRSVVMSHHEQVATALRERVTSMLADPVHAEGGKLALEVVFAIDAPEEAPELLIVVMPVAATAHEDWASRPEDLQTRMAARTVQAIFNACHDSGLPNVQITAGGHRGLLAVEVDVVGAKKALGDELEKHLHKSFRDALELVAAKVTISPRRVHADHLLGLVEEEEGELELDMEDDDAA